MLTDCAESIEAAKHEGSSRLGDRSIGQMFNVDESGAEARRDKDHNAKRGPETRGGKGQRR